MKEALATFQQTRGKTTLLLLHPDSDGCKQKTFSSEDQAKEWLEEQPFLTTILGGSRFAQAKQNWGKQPQQAGWVADFW